MSNSELPEGTGLKLGRVLVVYVGSAFAILQGVDLLIDRLPLPAWLFIATLVVLLLGLPVVLATAYVQAHRALLPRTGLRQLLTWRNAVLGGVGAFALLGAASAGGLVVRAVRGDSESWARSQGFIELTRLADEQKWDSAWALGSRVGRLLEGDTAFERLRRQYSIKVAGSSTPPGARVLRRSYVQGGDTTFELVGTTPLDSTWIPLGPSRWRFELPGYQSFERATLWLSFLSARAPTDITPEEAWGFVDPVLLKADSPHAGMVAIAGRRISIASPGLEHLDALAVDDYLLDRTEVTNRQYQDFVRANGYSTPAYWQEPLVRSGETLSFEAAMKLLVDRTGRPGPSTWEAGTYPDGEADHPVSGVSWHEAAAYARFAGKSLPTVYHWFGAAGTGAAPYVAGPANFLGKGTTPVGSSDAMSPSGVYDMAGNVREWTYNQDRPGERHILGGGYNDPVYQFTDAFAQPEWDRSATNGIRLAVYRGTKNLELASRPIPRPQRDFLAEGTASDAEFAIYRRLYEYDRRPLAARIERVDSTSSADYIRQTVTFDAGYGAERLEANVFLPRDARPPYQVVVLFPGSGAIHTRSSEDLRFTIERARHVITSGRALILPTLKGTFERGGGLDTDVPSETAFWREHVIAWAIEVRRTIDYAESRPDLDATRIAYYGISWGGFMGGLVPAVEPRIDAVVLLVGGLVVQRSFPEVDPVNFLPRVEQPVLMLNGRYDHFFPLETSQRPMFQLLGTPAAHKRLVVSDGGHFVPKPQVIEESLDWLDRYLGPVER